MKVIRDLNTKTSCQTSEAPTKIIKLNCDIFSNLIDKHFNYCINKDDFWHDFFLFEQSDTSNQNQWMLQWEI